MANRVVAKHLLSTERLPFTATYFSSIALTLYFAVGVSRCLVPCELVCIAGTCTLHGDNGSPLTESGTYQSPPFTGMTEDVQLYRSADNLLASEHRSHTLVVHCPDDLSHLVSRQLLPYGFNGLALRGQVWGQQGNGVDERVSVRMHSCILYSLVVSTKPCIDLRIAIRHRPCTVIAT